MKAVKITNKLTALLIAFLLTLTAISAPVAANAAGTVSLTVSSATASAGTDVVISINISANSGLAAGTFLLKYDTAKLTYKSKTYGPAQGELNGFNANYANTGDIRTIYFAPIHSEGISVGGSMLNITFTVKTGWTGSTPLTLTTTEFVDLSYNEIPKTISDGSVTVPAGPFVAITDGEGVELGDVLPVRIGLFGFYRDKSLKLVFNTNVTGAAVAWKSSNARIVPVGETSGIVTNKGIFARAADITVTLTKGSTVVTDTVRVVFYKYGWQLDYFSRM
jgi:hypothetical protein